MASKKIDTFEDGISVPGLTLKHLFVFLSPQTSFSLFDQANSDLYNSINSLKITTLEALLSFSTVTINNKHFTLRRKQSTSFTAVSGTVMVVLSSEEKSLTKNRRNLWLNLWNKLEPTRSILKAMDIILSRN